MAIAIALLLLSALIMSISSSRPKWSAPIQPLAPGQADAVGEGTATATPTVDVHINGRGEADDAPISTAGTSTVTPLTPIVTADTLSIDTVSDGGDDSGDIDGAGGAGDSGFAADDALSAAGAPDDQDPGGDDQREALSAPPDIPLQLLSFPAMPLTVSFTVSALSGVGSLTTTFTDATTPPGQATSYFWDFGNSQTATTTGPHTITYTTPGVYTVVLTASDGFTGGTYEQQVVVFDPGDVPAASFVYTISPPDLGTGLTQVCFDPFLTTGQIDTYAWYFSFLPGGGPPDFTLTAPMPVCHNYPPGDFLASLVVTGAMGRSSTRQELISIPPLPTPTLTLTPTFTPTFTPSPTPSACTAVSNDDFSGAIAVADGGSYIEPLVACATAEAPNLACGSLGSAEYSTWFTYTAGATDEVFRVNTFGSTYDTVLEIFDLADNLLGCNDDAGSLQSSLTLLFTAGQSAKIRVSGYSNFSCDPLNPTSCTQVVNVNADPVTACGPVPNDEASGAIVAPPLSGGVPFTHTQGDVHCATTNSVSPADPPQAGDSTRSVWYAYTVGAVDEDLVADTYGSNYTTALGVYTLSGGVFTPVVVDPFGSVSFTGTAGTTYYFQVTASDDTQIDPATTLVFTLFKSFLCSVVANDEATGAFSILAGQTRTQSSDEIRCASYNFSPPLDPARTCAGATPYNSVWYVFTPTNSQSYTVTTDGSQYDTVLTLHDGGTLAEIACDDNGSSFYPASSLTFSGIAGTTYYIRVTAFDEFVCGGSSETPSGAGEFSDPVLCGLTLNLSPELIAPTATPFASLRASFSPSVFSGVGTTPVCFTDTSTTEPASNPIVSWHWDFGDGQTSTDQNPCVNFTTPGTFTITLNVTSALGLSGRASNTVRVIQLSSNQTFFVIQQPTTTPSPTTAFVPDTPTPFPTSTIAPTLTPIATATRIPPEGRFVNSAICGGNVGGGGFPSANLNPCAPDRTIPRPPDWQPPEENAMVVREVQSIIETDPAQCPAVIYHSDRLGGWELFRLGDIPNVPNAPENLSQGNDPLYSSLSPSLNPTRGLFVFTTDRDGNWELYLGSIDGRPPVRLTYNLSAADLDPEWSPLGDLIAYETTRDGNWNIYTINVNTGEERQVTDDLASDVNASFAPDGLHLLFVSDRDGIWQIYEADLTTGAERRVSDGSGEDFDPAYSPDGARILFRSNRDGVERVYIMNADGSGAEAISPEGSAASSAVWSADSRYVAYQALIGDDQEIFVYDAETGLTRQITDNDVDDQAPTWRCDSTAVVFMSNADGDNDLYQVSALPLDADPISVPMGALQLIDDPADDRYPLSQPGDEAGSRQGRLPVGTRSR